MRGRITSALGGRAAEEVVYGSVTTGAENDLMQVNQIARSMVVRWGMSPRLGPLNLTEPGDSTISPQISPETASLADEEERRIVNECYQEAIRLLQENRDRLDRLTEAVLKKDTLDQDEIYAATGLSKPRNRALLAPVLPHNGSSRDHELARQATDAER